MKHYKCLCALINATLI